jgi:hypothetical protein
MLDFDWSFDEEDEEDEPTAEEESYSVFDRSASPIWEGRLEDRPSDTMIYPERKHDRVRRWGALVEVDKPVGGKPVAYPVFGDSCLRILDLARALLRDQEGGVIPLKTITARIVQHKGWQPRYVSQRMYMLWRMGRIRRYVAGKMAGVMKGELKGGQWFGVHYDLWQGWADDEL